MDYLCKWIVLDILSQKFGYSLYFPFFIFVSYSWPLCWLFSLNRKLYSHPRFIQSRLLKPSFGGGLFSTISAKARISSRSAFHWTNSIWLKGNTLLKKVKQKPQKQKIIVNLELTSNCIFSYWTWICESKKLSKIVQNEVQKNFRNCLDDSFFNHRTRNFDR